MTSFSSLGFSVSIFTLSCWVVGITILGASGVGNFLWSLFISLFEAIFMSLLVTKIFLLYPFVFPMFKFKLLGSMYMPVPTKKSTFDNACSNPPWYLSILMPIEWSSLISALNGLLRTCGASTVGAGLLAMLDLAWSWELRTKWTYALTDLLIFSVPFLVKPLGCDYPSCKIVWWRLFCGLYFMTKNTIVCRIKPVPMRPSLIRINALVITNTMIRTLNARIFNLAETISMWQRNA